MGYVYSIMYKQGCENQVVDSSARQHYDHNQYFEISSPCFQFIDQLKQEYQTLEVFQDIIFDMNKGKLLKLNLHWKNNLRFFVTGLFMVLQSFLVPLLLHEYLTSRIQVIF